VQIIRQQQMQALASIPRTAYESLLVKHFFNHYPRECGDAGLPKVRELINLGIDRARSNGYRGQRAAAIYINLMIILGSGFDSDPQIPWAAEQLHDSSISDPVERIQRVFRSTLNYLDATVGPDSGYIVRAMLRLRGCDLTKLDYSRSDFAHFIVDLFGEYYPEKADYQGPAPNRALALHALSSARAYGLTSRKGQLIFAMNAFMLGSGFDTDPLYPWANEVLIGSEMTDQDTKASRLLEQSLAYLQRSLRA
jgi:hypothetical protein